MSIKPVQWKKVFYYLDESFVWLILFLSVVFSEAVLKMIQTGDLTKADFSISWIKAIAGSLIAILVWGGMSDSFNYVEGKKKPSLGKRIYNSVLHGVAYRTMLGLDS